MENLKKQKKIIAACLLFVMIAFMFGSCSKDEKIFSYDEHQNLKENSDQLYLKSGIYYGIIVDGIKPFSGDSHGIPNQTQYKFYVANPTSDITKVDVIFTIPSGGPIIRSMQKIANGNYLLKQSLSEPGRYIVKYRVYRGSSYEDVNPNPSYVDNTRINFDGAVKKIVWPFGGDGSSWTSPYPWRMTCGPGCGHHTGTQSQSQDWARSDGNSLGKEVRSPLDGYVERKIFHESGGYLITIRQTIGNETYYFQVGHLQSLPSNPIGSYVQAGITSIGNVGNTGNSEGPHAHTSLKYNGTFGTPTAFQFSAQ